MFADICCDAPLC